MAWTKAVNHRDEGDKHRDARKWDLAAAAYKKHLAAHPDDAGIWVQYGHALKETRHFDDAESAYLAATGLAEDPTDAWTHLAYLLKDREKYPAALAAFREVADRSPSSDIDGELLSLSRLVQTKTKPERTSYEYLFSVQDMIMFLNHHATVSGIQRVQAGIALEIMADDGMDAGFILTDFTGTLEKGTFWLINKSDLKAAIEYATGGSVNHARLRRLLANCEQNATPINAGEGTTIMVLGSFWSLGNTVDQFLPAKRAGAKIAAYIYDIIPITHPEYCDASLVRDFTASLSEMSLVCDYLLTISDFTRITLDKFLAQHGARAIPTATVPLAHSLTGPTESTTTWPARMQKLEGREFVSYVSTIEGRKNHSYAVNVWRKLIDEGVDVPDLVFVGRKGWRINGLLDLLDGTHNLGGRVHFVHDLTDAELNLVYEKSLFTVFTSYVEGWGLPVGESLIHGTPCVASNTSSIPEVGGEFVDYVDPYNVNSGVEVIGRMIKDRGYLASRRENIATNFVPRDWKEVTRIFLERMADQKDVPSLRDTETYLPEGELFRPSDLRNPEVSLDSYVANPKRLLIAESFYPAEDFGAWMTGNNGLIKFKTLLEEGTSIVAYLKIRAAPWFGDCKAKIYFGSARDVDTRSLSGPMIHANGLFRCVGRVGADGVCAVTIEVEGEWVSSNPEDPRSFAIGLEGFGYAQASNVEARANLFETLTFTVASALKG